MSLAHPPLQQTDLRLHVLALLVLVGASACSSGNSDDTADDGGTCSLSGCVGACIAAGRSGGSCVDGSCVCTGGGDGDANIDDTGADDGAPGDADAPPDADGEASGGDADVGETTETPETDAEDAPAEEAAPAECGNGVTEEGEGCDGDPDQPYALPCGSEAVEQCVDCAWVRDPVTDDPCNLVDDDCDGATDEDCDEIGSWNYNDPADTSFYPWLDSGSWLTETECYVELPPPPESPYCLPAAELREGSGLGGSRGIVINPAMLVFYHGSFLWPDPALRTIPHPFKLRYWISNSDFTGTVELSVEPGTDAGGAPVLCTILARDGVVVEETSPCRFDAAGTYADVIPETEWNSLLGVRNDPMRPTPVVVDNASIELVPPWSRP